MQQSHKGEVKQPTVNHYNDCTADTDIGLEMELELLTGIHKLIYTLVAPLDCGGMSSNGKFRIIS